MTNDKKLHWTQTTEGKQKMAAVQKRAWRARKIKEKISKAERIVAKKVGTNNAASHRQNLYRRSVDTALAANELQALTDMLAYAALRLLGGGR